MVVAMKLLFMRFVDDVGYLFPIDSSVDDAVAAVAESVFSNEIVYSSLFKDIGRCPKLRLRCLPWENRMGEEEFTITITPMLTKDFNLFNSKVIRLFKRESWPLDADYD
jgi:hypothetical protein